MIDLEGAGGRKLSAYHSVTALGYVSLCERKVKRKEMVRN